MQGLPLPKKQTAGDGATVRGFKPRNAAHAQALNQAPDSIPAMVKPGEFVLPPDTVHAMGGPEALQSIVDATHAPAPDVAMVPRGFKPKAFFADGGMVSRRPGFDVEGWSQQQMQEQSQRTQDALAAGQAAQQQAETATAKPQAPAASQQNGYAPGTRGAEMLAAEQQKAQNRAATGAAVMDALKAPFGKGASPAAPSLNDPASPPPVAQNPTDQRLASGTQATPAAPAASAASGPSNPAATPGQAAGPGAGPGPDAATGRPVGFAPGVYQHGRGQYSDNPTGMGFARGFTGQPSAQNEAAWQRLADRSQAESMARVVAGQQAAQPAQPVGFQAPTVRHSGNDWQARNDLRNAEVSAGSIMNTRKWGGPGAENNPDVLKYKAMLASDNAARGFQPAADVAAMRENAGLQREGMQQAGATERAARGFAVDQQRIGIEGRRADSEIAARGFQSRAAGRLEKLQDGYLAAKTPEERAALAQQIRGFQGKDEPPTYKSHVLPNVKNADGSTTMGGVYQENLRTGGGQWVQPQGGAAQPLDQNQQAIAIRDNQNLSREQKVQALRKLGYQG